MMKSKPLLFILEVTLPDIIGTHIIIPHNPLWHLNHPIITLQQPQPQQALYIHRSFITILRLCQHPQH